MSDQLQPKPLTVKVIDNCYISIIKKELQAAMSLRLFLILILAWNIWITNGN